MLAHTGMRAGVCMRARACACATLQPLKRVRLPRSVVSVSISGSDALRAALSSHGAMNSETTVMHAVALSTHAEMSIKLRVSTDALMI